MALLLLPGADPSPGVHERTVSPRSVQDLPVTAVAAMLVRGPREATGRGNAALGGALRPRKDFYK